MESLVFVANVMYVIAYCMTDILPTHTDCNRRSLSGRLFLQSAESHADGRRVEYLFRRSEPVSDRARGSYAQAGKSPCGLSLHVRFGSLADIRTTTDHVRFTLKSGHAAIGRIPVQS